MADWHIEFNLDPVVKLACMATQCKHNLYLSGDMACNLKHIEVGEDARCMNYEPVIRETKTGQAIT